MSQIINIMIGVFILDLAALLSIALMKSEYSKSKKNKKIVAFLVMIFAHTIISYYLQGNIKTILILVIYCIAFKNIFSLPWGKAAYVTFIYFALLLIPDMIVTILLIDVFKVDVAIYYNSLAGSIFTNFLVSIFLIIIVFFLRKLLRRLVQITLNFDKQLIIYITFTIIGLAFFFWNIFNNYQKGLTLFINISLMVIFVAILSTLIAQMLKNRNLAFQYDNLIKYVKTYEEIIEKQRTYQHENKNQLLTIKSKLFDKNDVNEIIEYIDSICNEKTSFNKAKYAKLRYLPANGLKGLLYFKIDEAECQNINVNISISENIENSILYNLGTENYKQLCRVIGIYLDNAIEASGNTEDKLLGIEIYKNMVGVNVIISNSYNNDLDLEKLSQSRYSTKGKNRGYGLLLAKSIIGNNKMFEEEKEITKDLYVQKLVIK